MTKLYGYLPERTSETQTIPHAYSYNQHRRFKIIQRACLWVLRKLGCEYRKNTISYKSISIDTASVLAMAQAQYDAIGRQVGSPPRYVIVGRKQAHELVGQHLNSQLHFNFGCSYNKEVMGMTVIVAPWFDGVVCLSELE